jgi:hypothetical protein
LPPPGEGISSKEAEDHDEKIRKSHEWVVRVRSLSKTLSQGLSKTVDACEKFCLRDAVYFQNGPKSDHSLRAIQITFTELESLKKTLEYVAQSCDDFVPDVSYVVCNTSKVVGKPTSNKIRR